MLDKIKTGPFILSPFPDDDGDMEIEMNDMTPCSCVDWIDKDTVLKMVRALIKNFKFTEEDLNGSTD